MARVIYCKQNGPEEIDGIKYVAHPQGMISEDIGDEAVVDRLLGIPGFKAEDHDFADTSGPAASTATIKSPVPAKGDRDGDGVQDKEQRAALMARLKELNVRCSPAITLENLKAKVAEAEFAALPKGGQVQEQQNDKDAGASPAGGSGEGAGTQPPAAGGPTGAPGGGPSDEVF